MDKEAMCKKIQKLDTKIRFAGVISDKGHLNAGGMVEGKSPLEDKKKDEMLYLELALRVKMRQEFDEELGPVKFAMSYRDKVLIMSFPMGREVLLVSAEKELDFSKFPFSVLDIIKEYS